MPTQHKTRDEEERAFQDCFDSSGRVRPGVTRIRVPVKLIDSAGPARPHADYVVRVDHDITLARLPGFVARDAIVRSVLDDCYLAYDAAVSKQYRDPDNNGVGSHSFVGARPGDLCSINGSPGHLALVDGELRCVADKPKRDAAQRPNKFIENNLDWLSADDSDRNVVKDSAYSQYDAELANAWRRPK
jgi:hypothetical protein